MIQVTLPDGSQREFPGPVTVADVASSIGPGLAKSALAGKVDGKVVDTSYTIDKDKAYVTGPLVDAAGNDTGVKLQVRSGGAAQNFDQPTVIMYNNPDTLLSFIYTDDAIQ